jgi:hypothetical protein
MTTRLFLFDTGAAAEAFWFNGLSIVRPVLLLGNILNNQGLIAITRD